MKNNILEETIEAGLNAPTTQEDCCIPPKKRSKYSEVFYRPIFAAKLALW